MRASSGGWLTGGVCVAHDARGWSCSAAVAAFGQQRRAVVFARAATAFYIFFTFVSRYRPPTAKVRRVGVVAEGGEVREEKRHLPRR